MADPDGRTMHTAIPDKMISEKIKLIMSTCSRGSNGACEIASRTAGSPHDSAIVFTEGNFFHTPFINWHTHGFLCGSQNPHGNLK